MKKLFRRLRRTIIFIMTLVVTFMVSLITLGGICNLEKIIEIYKEFYGSWSWSMIVSLVLSGLVSGISLNYLLVKANKKSNEGT